MVVMDEMRVEVLDGIFVNMVMFRSRISAKIEGFHNFFDSERMRQRDGLGLWKE